MEGQENAAPVVNFTQASLLHKLTNPAARNSSSTGVVVKPTVSAQAAAPAPKKKVPLSQKIGSKRKANSQKKQSTSPVSAMLSSSSNSGINFANFQSKDPLIQNLTMKLQGTEVGTPAAKRAKTIDDHFAPQHGAAALPPLPPEVEPIGLSVLEKIRISSRVPLEWIRMGQVPYNHFNKLLQSSFTEQCDVNLNNAWEQFCRCLVMWKYQCGPQQSKAPDSASRSEW
jgi:hypothetical protein